MSKFIEEYSVIWGDNPASLLDEYNYHLELTKELDDLSPSEFNLETLYKLVLWKLSRFPYITEELLSRLKDVSEIQPKNHGEARELIKDLLRTSGIALPMASTILRFINPNTFQIIDDRAFRVLLPGEPKYSVKPPKISERYLNTSIDIYFKYLDKIHDISTESLPFANADRILYQLDIMLGNKIGSKV